MTTALPIVSISCAKASYNTHYAVARRDFLGKASNCIIIVIGLRLRTDQFDEAPTNIFSVQDSMYLKMAPTH